MSESCTFNSQVSIPSKDKLISRKKVIKMRPILRLYTAVFMLCVHLVASQQSNDGACQRITVPLCASMDYNMTYLPNRFGHQRQDKAELGIRKFYPLIKVKCSSALQPLLCSVYFPVCSKEGGGLEPCARLCREARNGCEPLMNSFRFQWPDFLDCESFSDDDLCYGTV